MHVIINDINIYTIIQQRKKYYNTRTSLQFDRLKTAHSVNVKNDEVRDERVMLCIDADAPE